MENKKGNVAMIAIIVIVVAITASVITWFVAKEMQMPVQQATVIQSSPATPQKQPVNKSTNEAAEDWQVYSNAKYGVEFKHPKSIIFISEKEEINPDNSQIILMVDGGKEWQNLPFPLLTINILSKKAYDEEQNNPDSYYYNSKVIEKGGQVYNLGIGFQDGPDQFLNFPETDDYKKIVSSFKFIDSTTSENLNWKTYISETFNASISLPSDWRLVLPGDGSLIATSENMFNGDAELGFLTSVSSLDKKEKITFMSGPMDMGGHKCTAKIIEINNQKVKESVCSDAGVDEIPGRYNYEFLDKDLILIFDNKTPTTDKVVSLIKSN